MARLVDSRDIVELQLKQADCELTIRKIEALQPPPAPATPASSQPLYYPSYPSPPPPSPAAASAPAPASAPTPAPAPAPAGSTPSKAAPALPAPKKSTSSHPPLKSPMAGTFYRNPGPGEPPFVKVSRLTKFEWHANFSFEVSICKGYF